MLIARYTYFLKASVLAQLIALVLMSTAQGAVAQTTDVFGRTASGTPGAIGTTGAAPNGQAANVGGAFVMPAFVRAAVGASIRLQSELNGDMQDLLARQRTGTSMRAAWFLVLLSFAYGVLHALGPGHGKLAVSAWLASHRARIVHAASLSMWSACVQALSAILLVGGAASLTRAGLGGVLTRASNLELVSYVALLGVGIWTLWSVALRRDCCDDIRVTLVPKPRLARFRPSVRTRCDESSLAFADDASYLGTNRAFARRGAGKWGRGADTPGSAWIARQIFMTGLVVGVRPCAGALFVLIAALANGIFIVGVLSAFAMAAGVALTVFAIALASLGVNRVVAGKRLLRRQAFEQARYRLALGGALFITVFAAWQTFTILLGFRMAGLA